jgi:hypothetical protein
VARDVYLSDIRHPHRNGTGVPRVAAITCTGGGGRGEERRRGRKAQGKRLRFHAQDTLSVRHRFIPWSHLRKQAMLSPLEHQEKVSWQ